MENLFYIVATSADIDLKGSAVDTFQKAITAITAPVDKVIFDSKAGNPIPLKGKSNLDIKADGEADNNGKKDTKASATWKVVGKTDNLSDENYATLTSLHGAKRCLYFIDADRCLIKKGIKMQINLSDKTEGNGVEEFTFVAEATGDMDAVAQRRKWAAV